MYCRVEVLHAEADAVEAQLAQEAQVVRADGARVDFDAVFARVIGGKVGEMRVQHRQQAAQLAVVQKGRRAAAQMQLDDAAAFVDVCRLAGDVALKLVEVFVGLVVVAGDDFVAAAVVADVFAEGDVNVEREVAPGGVARFEVADVVGGGEAVVKFNGGRVGGVARAALAVFADEFGIEVTGHGGGRCGKRRDCSSAARRWH